MMRLLPLVLLLASFQDARVESLIKALQSDDYEVQGRAAKDLELMGSDVLPRLRKMADDRELHADVRDWCTRIVARIESNSKRIPMLVERLAKEDAEAERELRTIGRAAIPALLASSSPRAEKLLRELATPAELESWDWDGQLEAGTVRDGFEYKFRLKQLPKEGPVPWAVSDALKWLARHQNPDGSWGAESFQRQCADVRCEGAGDPEYDEGLTALALLAFLGAGHSHVSDEWGSNVKKGLKWLMGRQAKDGRIGRQPTKFMYDHSLATMALCEAYGMTGARPLLQPAQRAVDFTVAAQDPQLGWGYTGRPTKSRSTVTGWAMAAVKSADLAKLKVPAKECFEKARRWFDAVSDPANQFRAGYDKKNSGKVFIPEKNETFVHHETLSAVAVLCRLFLPKGEKKDPALVSVNFFVIDLPDWKPDYIDFYYWHWATVALHAFDGPTGVYWKKWWAPLQNVLISNQQTAKTPCQNGSWSPSAERWGFEGGRVYATALNCITLLTPARYPKTGR